MTTPNPSIEEICNFMSENKPGQLSQEEVSQLLAENSKIVNSYYLESLSHKNSEYLPSSHFKTVNRLEQNLIKILGNIDPKELLDSSTITEAVEFYSDVKKDL